MATIASGNARPILGAGGPLLLALAFPKRGGWANTFMRSRRTYIHPRERGGERETTSGRREERGRERERQRWNEKQPKEEPVFPAHLPTTVTELLMVKKSTLSQWCWRDSNAIKPGTITRRADQNHQHHQYQRTRHCQHHHEHIHHCHHRHHHDQHHTHQHDKHQCPH